MENNKDEMSRAVTNYCTQGKKEKWVKKVEKRVKIFTLQIAKEEFLFNLESD